MDANPRRADDSGPAGEKGPPEGAHPEARDPADLEATLAAYERYKRRFVESGGTADRFDGLKLLQAARLQANRIWGVLTRVRGEDATPAPEQEVRNSLDGLAVEAEAARAKGRLRSFVRRLWPFGLPWA